MQIEILFSNLLFFSHHQNFQHATSHFAHY